MATRERRLAALENGTVVPIGRRPLMAEAARLRAELEADYGTPDAAFAQLGTWPDGKVEALLSDLGPHGRYGLLDGVLAQLMTPAQRQAQRAAHEARVASMTKAEAEAILSEVTWR